MKIHFSTGPETGFEEQDKFLNGLNELVESVDLAPYQIAGLMDFYKSAMFKTVFDSESF